MDCWLRRLINKAAPGRLFYWILWLDRFSIGNNALVRPDLKTARKKEKTGPAETTIPAVQKTGNGGENVARRDIPARPTQVFRRPDVSWVIPRPEMHAGQMDGFRSREPKFILSALRRVRLRGGPFRFVGRLNLLMFGDSPF